MQRNNHDRVIHINARNDEWVRVHRRRPQRQPQPAPQPRPVPASSGSGWVEPLLKLGLWVAAIVVGWFILMEILKCLLVYFMLSGAACCALKFFGRR